MGNSKMTVSVEDKATSYKRALIVSLLRLRQESPLCWEKLAIQVNEPSGNETKNHNSSIHWLDEGSVYTYLQNSSQPDDQTRKVST